MNHSAEAKRRRDQAEEFRAKAELMGSEQSRDQYVKIAEAYDKLAETSESLAGANQAKT